MEIRNFIDACKIEEIIGVNDAGLRKEYKIYVNKEAQKKLITHVVKNSILSQEKPQKGFRKDTLAKGMSEEYIENYAAQKFNDQLTIKEKLTQESIEDLIDTVAKKYENTEITRPDYKLESSNDEFDIYTVTLDIFPVIENINLEALAVDKIECEIFDAEVEKEIEKTLAESKYLASCTDKIITANDTIVIDFSGFIRRGKRKLAFQGGEGKGYKVELGKNQMLPEFEAALIDMKMNEEKTFPLQFPENYQGGLGGVLVEFDVKIGDILEQRKYENIDEYLKENKIDDIEILKTQIKTALTAAMDEKIKIIVKDQIFEALDKAYPDLEIPQSIYDRELESAQKSYEEKKKQEAEHVHDENCHHENDVVEPDLTAKELEDVVRSKVKLMLLLMAIAKEFNIKIVEVDLLIELFTLSKKMNIPYDALMNYYRSDAKALDHLKQQALETKILKFIFERATKEEKKYSTEELNNVYKAVMED